SLVRASRTSGDNLMLECIRVRFLPGEERGRFRIEPIAGSEFALEADAIVSSIGQDPDFSPLADVLDTGGALLRVDASQATDVAGVYAGGDVASSARFVTEAIGMGKRAALSIDAALSSAAGLQAQAPGNPPARLSGTRDALAGN